MIPVEELRKFCQISSQISVVRICIISDQRLTFPNSSLARVVSVTHTDSSFTPRLSSPTRECELDPGNNLEELEGVWANAA